MRLVLVAPCIALALAAQYGCSSGETSVVSPSPGLTSLQARGTTLDERARSALVAADHQMLRLESVRARSADVVTRDALAWELDALQKRIDVLLADLTSGSDFARDLRLRADLASLDRELDRGVNAEAWAVRTAEDQSPRQGNAERMPADR
jgi:hypothetical protein